MQTLEEGTPLESTPLIGSRTDNGISLVGNIDSASETRHEDHATTDESCTVHNDPEVVHEISTTSLRGSTLLLAAYNLQKSRRRATQDSRSATATATGPGVGSAKAFAGLESVEKSSASNLNPLISHVHDSFFKDARSLAAGTVPQSIVLALVIGTLCGFFAWLYYSTMDYLIELIWKTLPQTVIDDAWDGYEWLWILFIGFTMAICCGLCVVFIGEPGDLAFTIAMVHKAAYIPMDHVTPMATASLFSILAGSSLGPEAPLVAICGAIGGYVSRKWFGQRRKNVVRKHTLMGMAGALAAFFGVPLGGSLFALEVHSRFGIEYFEHMVESIFCGEVCLVVFRSLSGLPMEAIWNLSDSKMTGAHPIDVIIGGMIGILGAGVAYIFASFHWGVMDIFGRCGLLNNRYAVVRACIGGVVVFGIGVLIPHTMFWGEAEFEPIALMAPSSELPHVWPTSGAIGFEMDTTLKALAVGFSKIVTISFSVAAGFRGGFIFPFFSAGAAFGRVLHAVFPVVSVQLSTLCFAAGINVAITRTSLATTLILAALSGEPSSIAAILASSLCSLFVTSYMPFIKTQIARSDIDHTLFHQKHAVIVEEEHEIEDED